MSAAVTSRNMACNSKSTREPQAGRWQADVERHSSIAPPLFSAKPAFSPQLFSCISQCIPAPNPLHCSSAAAAAAAAAACSRGAAA